MEAERRMHGQRTYVPSHYRVTLNPSDLVALEGHGGSLAADLGESLHLHARRSGYLLRARPLVELEASREVQPGDVSVAAEAPAERPRAAPVAAPPRPQDVSPEPEPPNRAGWPAAAAADLDIGGTRVYAAPAHNVPHAVVAVHVPGRPPVRVPVRGSTMRIGRALDNDVVLPDEGVSRHHGQISVRLGTLVYADLGSTNGSFLNGSGVTEIALGPGDVLQLGGSSLTIETGA